MWIEARDSGLLHAQRSPTWTDGKRGAYGRVLSALSGFQRNVRYGAIVSGIIRSSGRRIRVYLLLSTRHARPAGGVTSRVYACMSTRNTGPGHGKRQAITQPAGI